MAGRTAACATIAPPEYASYRGVFAANAALRAAITPAGRGSNALSESERPTPKHVALNWARRLKRVFGIEVEQCVRCGGRLKVIASIEKPQLIARISGAPARAQREGGHADVLTPVARAAAVVAVLRMK
jgi:hypothetical protein